jgi:hypothetical protein
MMRTNITEVKTLLGTSTEASDATIEAYITAANVMVSGMLQPTSLSDSTLTEIEKHIAVHFIVLYLERIAKREKAGEVEVEYYGDYSMNGLQSTPYGQTAIMLDLTGTLRIMDANRAYMKAVKSR